jgi:hypothetical protein
MILTLSNLLNIHILDFLNHNQLFQYTIIIYFTTPYIIFSKKNLEIIIYMDKMDNHKPVKPVKPVKEYNCVSCNYQVK